MEAPPCCNNRVEIEEHCLKRLEPILDFLSKKWAFHIISILHNHEEPKRFNEIESEFEKMNVNISPKTITTRLREAEDLELISRQVYAEIPPRVEYTLTDEGKGFIHAIIPLFEWAERRFPHKCIKLKSLKENHN